MSVRSAAVRRAAQIRSERAAAFAAREAMIEQRAVEFLQAAGRAENVVEAARQRCEQIMATARGAAEQARGQAATAVAGLQGLGVVPGEVAEITGMSAREIRDLLARLPSTPDGGGPAGPDTAGEGGAGGDRGENGAGRTRLPTPAQPAAAIDGAGVPGPLGSAPGPDSDGATAAGSTAVPGRSLQPRESGIGTDPPWAQ
jgi:hypothetical protein